ncbi:hypothetical protein BX616_005048 [Lobosporangium transversale]|nr:hypothetical protein BX616_005048 [Lobosporangium transversale]
MSQTSSSAEPPVVGMDANEGANKNIVGANSGYNTHTGGILISLKAGGSDVIPQNSYANQTYSSDSSISMLPQGVQHRENPVDVMGGGPYQQQNFEAEKVLRPEGYHPLQTSTRPMFDHFRSLEPLQGSTTYFRQGNIANPAFNNGPGNPYSNEESNAASNTFGTDAYMLGNIGYTNVKSESAYGTGQGESGGWSVPQNGESMLHYYEQPHGYEQYANAYKVEVDAQAPTDDRYQDDLSQTDAEKNERLKKLSKEQVLIKERLSRESLNRSLFIRNLGYAAQADEVRKLFEPYGEIQSLCDKIQDRGMAFIRYFDIRAAEYAKKEAHGTILHDRAGSLSINIKGIDGASVSDQELEQFFSQYGEVRRIRPPNSNKFPRILEFFDIRHTVKAYHDSHGKYLKDGKIECYYAWDEVTVTPSYLLITAKHQYQQQDRLERNDRQKSRGGKYNRDRSASPERKSFNSLNNKNQKRQGESSTYRPANRDDFRDREHDNKNRRNRDDSRDRYRSDHQDLDNRRDRHDRRDSPDKYRGRRDSSRDRQDNSRDERDSSRERRNHSPERRSNSRDRRDNSRGTDYKRGGRIDIDRGRDRGRDRDKDSRDYDRSRDRDRDRDRDRERGRDLDYDRDRNRNNNRDDRDFSRDSDRTRDRSNDYDRKDRSYDYRGRDISPKAVPNPHEANQLQGYVQPPHIAIAGLPPPPVPIFQQFLPTIPIQNQLSTLNVSNSPLTPQFNSLGMTMQERMEQAQKTQQLMNNIIMRADNVPTSSMPVNLNPSNYGQQTLQDPRLKALNPPQTPQLNHLAPVSQTLPSDFRQVGMRSEYSSSPTSPAQLAQPAYSTADSPLTLSKPMGPDISPGPPAVPEPQKNNAETQVQQLLHLLSQVQQQSKAAMQASATDGSGVNSGEPTASGLMALMPHLAQLSQAVQQQFQPQLPQQSYGSAALNLGMGMSMPMAQLGGMTPAMQHAQLPNMMMPPPPPPVLPRLGAMPLIPPVSPAIPPINPGNQPSHQSVPHGRAPLPSQLDQLLSQVPLTDQQRVYIESKGNDNQYGDYNGNDPNRRDSRDNPGLPERTGSSSVSNNRRDSYDSYAYSSNWNDSNNRDSRTYSSGGNLRDRNWDQTDSNSSDYSYNNENSKRRREDSVDNDDRVIKHHYNGRRSSLSGSNDDYYPDQNNSHSRNQSNSYRNEDDNSYQPCDSNFRDSRGGRGGRGGSRNGRGGFAPRGGRGGRGTYRGGGRAGLSGQRGGGDRDEYRDSDDSRNNKNWASRGARGGRGRGRGGSG